ncbi:MAG: hypothetical protein GEU94_06065 [Micromonosporaceae bacterium]|nr:hypothetical protein [Micromonosporaceae bacterium]
MLFERRLRDGISAGKVTVTFRRWRRSQVKSGGRYRTGADGGRGGLNPGQPELIEVDQVDIVSEADVTDADARDAGYDSAADLLAGLRGPSELPLHRIRFRRLDEPDPRASLAADTGLSEDDVAAIDRRLDRMDRAGSDGPWTAATLAAIAASPGVVAAELAASLRRERLPFKRDVRKLKELGLTQSLPVGYRLSPRGQTYLNLTRRASPARS